MATSSAQTGKGLPELSAIRISMTSTGLSIKHSAAAMQSILPEFTTSILLEQNIIS